VLDRKQGVIARNSNGQPMIGNRPQAPLASLTRRHQAIDVLANVGGPQHTGYESPQASGGVSIVVSIYQDGQRYLRVPEQRFRDALSTASA